MIPTPLPAQREINRAQPAAVPHPTRRRSFRLPLLVLILFAAAAFRIAVLADVPPGLQHDEVFHAHDAFTVRQGYTPLWFSSNAGNEPLYIYLMAFSTGLIGDHALGIRFTALVCGLLALALTYRWAAISVGRRSALLAIAFMAVSFWPVWMSRVGLRAVSLPPVVALAAWLFTRAMIQTSSVGTRGLSLLRSMVPFVLAGLALGLTLYTYPAAFAVPLVFFACYVYLLVFRREVLIRTPWGHLAFWLAAILAYLPLGLALSGQEGGYLRVQQTGLPLQALVEQGDPGPLLEGVARTFGMWFVQGDPLWRYNVAGRPVFGPLLGALFALGVIYLLWHTLKPTPGGEGDPRPEAIALAPLFLLIGALPSAVTDSPPAFLRASAALPAAFVALGAGYSVVRRFAGGRTRWLGLAALLLVILTASFTAQAYFLAWTNHEEVQRVYRADLAAIADYLHTHDAPGGVAVSTSEPHHLDRFIFDYTPHGDADIHWFDGLNALVAPAGGAPAWLFITREPAPAERLQSTILSQLPLIEERTFSNGSLAYRLYQIPPGEAFLETFPPPTSQGVWVSDALAFPPDDPAGVRTALAYPVQFGDVVQLAGYESPSHNPAGTWLPVTLVFRVLRDVTAPEPWVLFGHVLDANGALAAGRDFLSVPASTWRAGDVFVQLYDIALPADLAPGRYHVEIGLYSQADGSRFPVMVDGDRAGDRLLLQPVEVVQP